MRYLIIYNDPNTGEQRAFTTQWYQYENHHVDGMIVINTVQRLITFDGQTWQDIEQDNL